ncbi:MAG: sodium:solute symporter family protein [Bryobacterales bacterium]|nr:sodium:solute symporter family protein [Bryobacterales bacterium]
MKIWEVVAALFYLFAVVYLGYLGWKRTRNASDYMLAGRKAHPAVMALSYGSTFISTSAIVGFGGAAGMFGMSLLWLTFCNVFVGIFIAFVFLGGRTRRLGHALDAHTFPELLGRRYNSRSIQIFAGLVIFLFMPVYTAAVLIGGSEFIVTHFGVPYEPALVTFAVLTAAYVMVGGLKGVMYTDALQAGIMLAGMTVLLVATYSLVGGVVSGHEALTAMKAQVFAGHSAIGHQGWTSMPLFGWGDNRYNLWWIVVTTLVLGVGIGVLAQPQLIVRFMTVKSDRELNRAVWVGGVFILMMTGVAFTVGALSNVYFFKHEVVRGRLIGTTEKADVIAKQERFETRTLPCRLLHIDTTGNGSADTHLVAAGLGKAEALLPRAEIATLADGRVEVRPKSSSFLRAVVASGPGTWMFNADSIIPIYITRALPRWFGVLFLLTLLAAAMSTLSSQIHTMGTGIGHDVFKQLAGPQARSIPVTRAGMMLGILLALAIGYYARGGYVIARATAIFFGLCAAAFLPAFVGGLYSKRVTAGAAKASILTGALVTTFWLVFIKDSEAQALGICNALFGVKSLLANTPNWPVVDPLIVALPLSTLVLAAVTLMGCAEEPAGTLRR